MVRIVELLLVMDTEQVVMDKMDDNEQVVMDKMDDNDDGDDDTNHIRSALEKYFESGYQVLKTQQLHYGNLLDVVKQELLEATASDLNYDYSPNTSKKRMVHLVTHIVDYKQGKDETAIREFCKRKQKQLSADGGAQNSVAWLQYSETNQHGLYNYFKDLIDNIGTAYNIARQLPIVRNWIQQKKSSYESTIEILSDQVISSISSVVSNNTSPVVDNNIDTTLIKIIESSIAKQKMIKQTTKSIYNAAYQVAHTNRNLRSNSKKETPSLKQLVITDNGTSSSKRRRTSNDNGCSSSKRRQITKDISTPVSDDLDEEDDVDNEEQGNDDEEQGNINFSNLSI